MLHPTDRLRQFEDRDERDNALSYPDALARYAALWQEALVLDPALGADWADDLAPDLAVARAVNGLSPAA